jgi:hypothetical protein
MKNTNNIRENSYVLSAIFVMMIFVLTMPSMAGDRGDESGRFFTGIGVNLFYPSGSSFKEIYTSSITVPGFQLGYHLSKEFYLLTGFEWYSASGNTPAWDWDTELKQKIFSFGGGYLVYLSEKFRLSGDVSVIYLSYTEEIKELALKQSNHCTGFRLDAGLWYRLSKHIRAKLSIGFDNAKDTVEDIRVNLGGLRSGIAIYLTF